MPENKGVSEGEREGGFKRKRMSRRLPGLLGLVTPAVQGEQRAASEGEENGDDDWGTAPRSAPASHPRPSVRPPSEMASADKSR